MTINQALKQKNRIVGELNRLKTIFARENSRVSTSTSKVDRAVVANQIFETSNALIQIKARIAIANTGISLKLEELREYKDMLTFLGSLSTLDGTVETFGYNGALNKVVYDAFYKQEKVDELKLQIQNRINAAQDEVDAYNATTHIPD